MLIEVMENFIEILRSEDLRLILPVVSTLRESQDPFHVRNLSLSREKFRGVR